jgi:Flp pilus assembly protein TadB
LPSLPSSLPSSSRALAAGRALDEAAEMIESDTPPQIGTATVGASEAAR